MAAGMIARLLPDGRRLHLQHGPIDLVIEAWGAADEVRAAYAQAEACFADVLPTLCRELPRLRLQVDDVPFDGPVAERMRRACLAVADGSSPPPAGRRGGSRASEARARDGVEARRQMSAAGLAARAPPRPYRASSLVSL